MVCFTLANASDVVKEVMDFCFLIAGTMGSNKKILRMAAWVKTLAAQGFSRPIIFELGKL